MMTSTITAIQTRYNGYHFRSRLEARWAVFFDTLGIKYFYEHEGFDLGDAGWYLPDFYLPDYNYWIEIKATEDIAAEEENKIDVFMDKVNNDMSEFRFYVLYGTPGKPDGYDGSYYADCGDHPYLWCECPTCGSIDLQFDGRSARNSHKPDCEILLLSELGKDHLVYGRTDDKVYNAYSERLALAFTIAREKRF